ncbi:DNA polymerase III subunit gamma/tau [Methylocella tundrae]|uniref:DNA polymerase III subunit gamma/tau n=2 Tax=Methylocella tundrae TaxID=227605 RepID=A0A4U8YVF2_METTU|nr:DNA polymerase III subunit gamma/tau [Methylocella tundrae]VFU07304.1 DNA polymerase III subunit gamma/tau [Methylocella tundrae]
MQDDRIDGANGQSDAAMSEGSSTPAALPLDAPTQSAAPYRVLARKYRPAGFEDLIGQEAMVRTLSNAFDLDRIHQAYILTGVRGVGKTTTARILARAFNYELPAREGRAAVTRPTIDMPEFGVHCQAIIESRHVDVIEMDAASHTGIDDVREIIEGARYRPVMARTKVYIIDEVHMLSKQAFNGLLKTLEEPPDHVKFLFATTEIEKVPVTVRSRCQRFDLRRIEAGVLIKYLGGICAKEGVAIEDEALALIARAAEGSARDALSLLDQAIAHGPAAGQRQGLGQGLIAAETLRAMLGLADRGRIIDLFQSLMQGQMAQALGGLKELYDSGADPAAILIELAEFVHLVTRLKLAPEAVNDAAITPDERSRGMSFAENLPMSVLSRVWQLLSKGLQEVKDSARPLAAADMVLVRLAYAADLPTPDEALRKLASLTHNFSAPGDAGKSDAGKSGGSSGAAAPPAAAPGSAQARPVRDLAAGAVRSSGAARALAPQRETADPAPRLERFEEIVALAAQHRDIQLKLALERDVRLVRFEDGSIEFSTAPGASPQLAQTLMRRLQEWTGRRWMVAVSNEAGAPSLREVADARAQEAMNGVRADPFVRRALEVFPGAEIVAVRAAEEAAPAAVPQAAKSDDEDIGFVDDDAIEADQ